MSLKEHRQDEADFLEPALANRQLKDRGNIFEHLLSIVSSWQSVDVDSPVASITTDLTAIRQESLPDDPQDLERVFSEIRCTLLPSLVHTNHPLFLAYVTPPSLDIASAAAGLASFLNQNVSFADLSPGGTAIEETVIRWLCDIVGFDRTASGIITSGGSMANLQALVIARRWKAGEIGRHGMARRRLRVYCSEHAHRSIHKAATVLGIGAENVVSIRADDRHRIDVNELERAVTSDTHSQTFLPLAIVGSAGTRLAGAFDDLESLGALAKKAGLWLHIDGAFGGFLKLASQGPEELAHLHAADSITIDPHKLLFVPFNAGALLVKKQCYQFDAFGEEGEYLENSVTPGVDFADYGLELGRGMAALKVWLALKYFGTSTYSREYDRLLELNRSFRRRISEDPDFELLGPGPSIITCFRWIGNHSGWEDLLDAINQDIRRELLGFGDAYLNIVKVNGRYGLRASFSNFHTRREHIDLLLTKVRDAASRAIANR